jgi:NADH-quinone oxidoreductase subunit G
MPEKKDVTLTINGKPVTVPEGTPVIEAAKRAGSAIPHYCYHPALGNPGNCRLCVVEVEGMPKLQVSCRLPAAQGMVVRSTSPNALRAQQASLEFHLVNHPLDCPVCDQAGECGLQDYYMQVGLYTSQVKEDKLHKEKRLPIGKHVMLDQERCILCSRCVRFADEITKTGEFGIFDRGDRAQLGLYPGQRLDNPYSANVVDICPVGALTELNFRFKARVWYLSSAPTVCNGCAQGCNVDMHYVLDRPHLNDGARVLRLKPRYNADVNQWWMCDEGRYGFGWVDKGRVTKVRNHGVDATWEQAIPAIATGLEKLWDRPPGLSSDKSTGSRIGVIAGTQLTNEDLFLIREIFQGALGARVTAAFPTPPGGSDDFLIKADKSPNTRGATLLGLSGPDAPTAASIVDEAIQGGIEALWIFGHDLTTLLDEATLQELSRKLRLFVFSGTNENPTASVSHWALPTAAYMEKDGTFVNCHGRIQRVGRAFPPLPDSREDWSILLEIARQLSLPLAWRNPQEIFVALAKTVPAFAGLSYEKIGLQGVAVP